MDFHGLLRHETVALSSLAVRNTDIRFSERADIKYVEDFDFQPRLAVETSGRIVRLGALLPQHRVHAASGSADVDAAQWGQTLPYLSSQPVSVGFPE